MTCWISLEKASVVKEDFCSRLSMAMIRWKGLFRCSPASRVTSSTRPKVVTMPVYPVSTVAVQAVAMNTTTTMAQIRAMSPFFMFFISFCSSLVYLVGGVFLDREQIIAEKPGKEKDGNRKISWPIFLFHASPYFSTFLYDVVTNVLLFQ